MKLHSSHLGIQFMMKFIHITGSTDSTDKQTDWQTDTNTIRQIQWKWS